MAKAQNKNESESKTKKIVLWISVFLLILAIITTALLLTLCDAKGDDVTGGGDTGGGDNPIVECEHNIEILPAVAPTCEEKGLTEGKKCSKCGEIILAQEEVSPLGHNWGEWRLDEYPLIEGDVDTHSRVCLNDSTHIDVELCDLTGEVKPTCFEDGYLFCEICGRKDSPEGYEATGHVWGELVDNGDGTHTKICANDSSHTEIEDHILVLTPTEPTCEEDGVYMDVCECGYSCPNYNYEPQWPLGHDYVWTDNGDGTCTGVCSRDATHTITQSHELEVIGEDPDCENGGYCHETCLNCGLYVYTEYDPLGHIWLEWSHDESKTAEEGVHYHSRQCQRYWDDHINCQDKDYAPCTFEVIEEVPATCLEDGSTTYKCTGCGYTYTETVTARGNHNFDYEDRDETNHFSICADCGEAYNIEPHTEYLTETVVPATCEAQGYTEYMCTYCLYTYKDNYVDALGHNWGEWTDNGDGTHTRVCANDSEHTETVPHVGMDDCVCDDCGFASHVTHDGNIFDCDICGADTSFLLIDSEHMSPDVSFTPEQIGTETLKDGDKILIGYTYASNAGVYYDFTTEENVGYKTTLGTDKAGYVDLNEYLVEVVKNDDGTYSFLTNFGKYLAMDSTGALICLDAINGDSSWTIMSYGPGNDKYEAYITNITNVGQGRTLNFTENSATRFSISKVAGTVIKVFRGVNVGHEMSVASNNDNTHTYVCTGCDLNGVEDCHGGTATCTDKAICDVCNSSYGDALGHAYPDTWTDNGDNHIKVCANGCGIDLTETHTYEETDRTPADCLNAEVITYTCACGNSYTEEGAPATGHDYELVEASLDELKAKDYYWLDDPSIRGALTHVCVDCGDTHNVERYWQDEDSLTYHAENCLVCGTLENVGDEIAGDNNFPVATEYEFRAITSHNRPGAEFWPTLDNDITFTEPVVIEHDFRYIFLNGHTVTATGVDEQGRGVFVIYRPREDSCCDDGITMEGGHIIVDPADDSVTEAYAIIVEDGLVYIEDSSEEDLGLPVGSITNTVGNTLFLIEENIYEFGVTTYDGGTYFAVAGDSPEIVKIVGENNSLVDIRGGLYQSWDPTQYVPEMDSQRHYHVEYDADTDVYHVVGYDVESIEYVAPTCTTDGYQTYKCVECGELHTVTYNAQGHQWSDWGSVAYNENNELDIIDESYKYHARWCKRDGCYESEIVEHDLEDTGNKSPATCTLYQYDIYHCTICDKDLYQFNPENDKPLGHLYEYVDNGDGTHTATCTREGCTTSTTGHVVTEAHTHEETGRLDADCENDGIIIYTCVCNNIEAETIPATGHDYPDTWTDNGDGTHIKVCANGCGIDLTETHTYEETGRTPADCLNAEVITLTCACGNSFTEEGAPATGHDYSWIDNGDGTCTGTCVNDSSHVEIADHIDDNTDELCDNCGANLHVHQWGQWTFSPDGTTHTRVCLLDDSHTETEDHTGMETDCTCDVCGGANHVTHDNNMTDCDKCGAIFNEITANTGDKVMFGAYESNQGISDGVKMLDTSLDRFGKVIDISNGAFSFDPNRYALTIESVSGYEDSGMDNYKYFAYRTSYGKYLAIGEELIKLGYIEEGILSLSDEINNNSTWLAYIYDDYSEEGYPIYSLTSTKYNELGFASYYVELDEDYFILFFNDIARYSNTVTYNYSNVNVGHDVTYTDNGDGTHTISCSICGIISENEPCYGGTATCTDKATCTGCGAGYGETTHTNIVIDNEVPATCTTTGLTAGSHCEDCGEVIVAQIVEPINENNHLWAAGGTDNLDGITHTRVCTNDPSHTIVESHSGARSCYCDVCGGEYHFTHDGSLSTCDGCSGYLFGGGSVPGGKVIICNSAGNMVFDASTPENFGKAIDNSDGKVFADLSRYLLTVEEGSISGSYAYKTPFGKYLAVNEEGQLIYIDEINGYSSWTNSGAWSGLTNAMRTDLALGINEGQYCTVNGGWTGVCVFDFTNVNVGHEVTYTDNGDGTHTVTCSICGLISANEPCYGGKATCTDKAICDVCNSSYGDALGHAYPDTWTDNGENHIKVCANGCGIDLTEAHSYTETSRVDATCESDGSVTYTCVCGNTYTETLTALGHAYGQWIDDENGTSHTRVCANDSAHTETENHNHTETDRVDATCENDGSVTYTCVCGNTYTETLTALGHAYGQWIDDENGTSHTRVCANDSAHTETENHNHTETDRVDATCENDGSVTYTCVCGNTYTETLTALGHDYPDTWTDNGENHIKVCGNGCGVNLTEAHSYTESRTPATCESAEIITYTCVCGNTYTVEGAPATGHNYSSAWTDNGDGTHIKVCKNGCGINLVENHLADKKYHDNGRALYYATNKCSACGYYESLGEAVGSATNTYVSSESDFIDAMKYQMYVYLEDDIIITKPVKIRTGFCCIHLQGHTLTATGVDSEGDGVMFYTTGDGNFKVITEGGGLIVAPADESVENAYIVKQNNNASATSALTITIDITNGSVGDIVSTTGNTLFDIKVGTLKIEGEDNGTYINFVTNGDNPTLVKDDGDDSTTIAITVTGGKFQGIDVTEYVDTTKYNVVNENGTFVVSKIS